MQHGKDFIQILKYMQNKFKKKSDPTIPNLTKNQVWRCMCVYTFCL